jgi:TRAP-type mannitol/chloroaromatic compound transport system substrate-binding protein
MKKWWLVLLATALVFAPVAIAQPRPITWRVQTTWTPVQLHYKNAVEMAERIKEMSGGRLVWEILAAGAVVGPFEVLDAVNRGVVDAGHSWPGYWTGKNTAAALFGGTIGGPFGMSEPDYITWIYAGGGNDLYNEFLRSDLKMPNVVAFLQPIDFEEPLGWFKKPITSLADFRGIKMRSSGLGADLLKEMGISAVVLGAGDIVPALERGVVDAVEWSNPASDIPMGFQDVAKYLILPSFRQQTTSQELLVNRRKWDELPADLKAIVRAAVLAQVPVAMARQYFESAKIFHELGPKYGVKVVTTPPEVLEAEIRAIDKVLEMHAQKNPTFARVLQHQKEFARVVATYNSRMRAPYARMVEHYFGKP